MLTIWKFPLVLTDHQDVEMPISARFLHVALQEATLCLWAEVDPNATKELRTIRVIGTGHPLEDTPRKFIGTVVMGPFMWHVYDVTSESPAASEPG
jgi:hypothetical protein